MDDKYSVLFLYNTPHYNINLDITWLCGGSHFLTMKFYKGMWQENDHIWSFSYNIPLLKCPIYNMIHL